MDDDDEKLRRWTTAWFFDLHDRETERQTGRLFAFFFSGWIGTFLAHLALAFDEWGDFAELDEAILRNFEDKLFSVILWPLEAMITPPWSIVHLFIFLGLVGAVLIYLSTPFPSPIWLIGFAGYGSVVPLISNETAIPSLVLLGFLWVGLGGFGWYVLQYRHRNFIEKVRRLFSGEPEPVQEANQEEVEE